VIGSSVRISEQVYRRSSGGATPIGSSEHRPRFGMLRGRALIRGPRNSSVKRSDDQRSRRDPARSRDKFGKTNWCAFGLQDPSLCPIEIWCAVFVPWIGWFRDWQALQVFD